MGDRGPGAEGGHDPGGRDAQQHGRRQPRRPRHQDRLSPDLPARVPPGAPGVRGVDGGGLPDGVEGHGGDVHDLVGDRVGGDRRHPEPGHDRDQRERPGLPDGEVGGHREPGPQGPPRRGPGALRGPHPRAPPQQRVPAQGEQTHPEGQAPAQHGGCGGTLNAVAVDEERVADQDQPAREEREPHRGPGVAGALEDAVDEVLGEEDGDARHRDREVGHRERQRGAAAQYQPGQRLPQRQPARHDHRRDQRAQRPAPAHRGPHRARIPGAPGVRDQHGRTGSEDQGDAEQHVLGVGRHGDGGDGGAAEPGDPEGVDDAGGDGGQQREVDGMGERDELPAVGVHRSSPSWRDTSYRATSETR